MTKLTFLYMLLLFGVTSVYASHGQDHPLMPFAGKYKFQPGSHVPEADISILDSTRLQVLSSAGTATLVRAEGDLFVFVEYEGTAEFVRNSDGKVVSIKVKVAGLDMEGTKEAGKAVLPLHPMRTLPFDLQN
jgi:hypothetical protein